jgi:surfeit locus 1 family protein
LSAFRPARGPTVLTLVAVLGFSLLGVWQVRRHLWRSADLAEKSARIDAPALPFADALRDPRGSAFRRVALRGRFELADTVLVGPVAHAHQLGARVLTPLRVDATGARVLVDRGWIPERAVSDFLPRDEESAEVSVTGLALELAVGAGAPGSRANRHTHFPRFHPDRPGIVADLTRQLPYALQPVMVQSIEPGPGGVPFAEPSRPVSPVDHRAYALTWFAVAAISLAAWVEYGRRRGREE